MALFNFDGEFPGPSTPTGNSTLYGDGPWPDWPTGPRPDPTKPGDIPTLPKPGGDGGTYGTMPLPKPDGPASPWPGAPPIAPAHGSPNYTPIPGWMNPNTAPLPTHPFYKDFLAANPGYTPKPTQSAAEFIKQYQAAHHVSEGVQPLYQALKAAGYNVAPYLYGSTPSNNEVLLDGQKYKLLGGEGTPAAYWYTAGQTDGGGGAYNPSNPFSDPATKNYIDLLNARIQELLKPPQNPQLDTLQAYLKKYFEQLQGPTYTDAQRATIQTQTLDPMERQRQQELKQVPITMASRGITPGSGPYLQAERDINQKFDSLRSQTQGGFALNEINQGRQDASKAVDVGSANASLTNGTFLQQDARANQAVNYGKQIPDLAQARMAQAIQLLNGQNASAQNTTGLLAALAQFQKQGTDQTQQDSAFWSNLIALIAKNYGL